jgi:hypothetical protein
MEIIAGIIVYLLMTALFIAAGKFLKSCDEGINEMKRQR